MSQPPNRSFDWNASEDGEEFGKELLFESATSLTTDLAPSRPQALPPTSPREARRLLSRLQPGDRVGEFELIAELGRGGFGCVFLARQSSLDRLVALKITPDQGREGRTLAQLEHENIVGVYSELVDVLSGLRMLCMPYVAGPTMQKIIDQLQSIARDQWSGQQLLDIVDGLNLEKMAFDPTALRDRELLSHADWIETVCWIGERLAEALAYAADRGVLHRDIKPANILVSQYGRPLLADFNLASHSVDGHSQAAVSFGGTLAYMSPESLDAFNPEHSACPEATDTRSDIYSLGVVLFQLRNGHLPFDADYRRGPPSPAILTELASERRNEDPRRYMLEARHPLDGIIERCLAPHPDNRFANAMELAETLAGCRMFRRAERQLPRRGLLVQPAVRWTFAWLIFLGLVPHLIGSVIQIGYNSVRIVGQLTPEQHEAFIKIVIGYNLVMYPLCCIWLLGKVVPVLRAWQSVALHDKSELDALDRARQQAVELPKIAAIVGCIGWFPGAILFPLGLSWFTGAVPLSIWGHFFISFALAGLVAVTYSFFGTQLAILHVIYVRMWNQMRGFQETAARELRPIDARLRLFQLLAGTIPLVGAILIVAVSPRLDHAAEYDAFRLLVALFILMGMFGVQLASSIQRQTSRILASFVGPPANLLRS